MKNSTSNKFRVRILDLSKFGKPNTETELVRCQTGNIPHSQQFTKCLSGEDWIGQLNLHSRQESPPPIVFFLGSQPALRNISETPFRIMKKRTERIKQKDFHLYPNIFYRNIDNAIFTTHTSHKYSNNNWRCRDVNTRQLLSSPTFRPKLLKTPSLT